MFCCVRKTLTARLCNSKIVTLNCTVCSDRRDRFQWRCHVETEEGDHIVHQKVKEVNMV
jgi:hypothetical protein